MHILGAKYSLQVC